MLKRLLTLSLPMLSLAAAACGQEDGADFFLKLDGRGCTPSCELVRFDFQLRREDAPGSGCAIHSSSQLTSDLTRGISGLEVGEEVTALITAFCRVGDASEVVGADCCIPLGACLPKMGTENPDCVEAKNACPIKSGGTEPWVNGAAAEAYFESWCTLREKCAQCIGHATFTVTDGQTVDLPLRPSAYCSSPAPLESCP